MRYDFVFRPGSVAHFITSRFPGQPSYDARYILRYKAGTLTGSRGLTNLISFHPTIIRPETVESLFIAYRLTGNPKYREYGWKIFQSIEKYCRIEGGGYASLLNVDSANSIKMDKMETFFLVRRLRHAIITCTDFSDRVKP